jgi:hypothetical protein
MIARLPSSAGRPENCPESTSVPFYERPLFVDDRDDREVELLGEGLIALVMCRHRHDRPGAVIHQDVVGDPDRDPCVVDRIAREEPGEDTGLLLCRRALLTALDRGAAHVLSQLVCVLGALDDPLDERMLGRQHEERRAEERVGPRREDGNVLVELVDPEQDLGAF